MNTDALITQLFLYEESGNLVPLDSLPKLNDTGIVRFNNWIDSKRTFLPEEITSQHWIKSCSKGYITELIFHDNGSLDEYTLFERLKTTGRWVLNDGILELEIRKDDNVYKSSVIAHWEAPMHSAVEYKNDELHAYLKLVQTRPHLKQDLVE